MRPKPVSDFDPNCQATHTGNSQNPTIHLPSPGKQIKTAMKAHNPGKDGSAKNHGTYPKNAHKLRG